MKTKVISRRSAFVAAGAGTLAFAALAARANAAEMSAGEKANVQVVAAFLKAWGETSADGAKLGAHLAENCVLRMEEGKPAITGKAAAIAAFNGYLDKGARFDIKTLDTFAKGPVVANNRVDAMVSHGKAGSSFPVVGVFVLKDGKIAEWSDFIVPKAT